MVSCLTRLIPVPSHNMSHPALRFLNLSYKNSDWDSLEEARANEGAQKSRCWNSWFAKGQLCNFKSRPSPLSLLPVSPDWFWWKATEQACQPRREPLAQSHVHKSVYKHRDMWAEHLEKSKYEQTVLQINQLLRELPGTDRETHQHTEFPFPPSFSLLLRGEMVISFSFQ